MARKLVPKDTCDRHQLLGLGEVLAEGSIVLSLNGGPAQEYDLCSVCMVACQPVFELYQTPGRRPDEAQRKEARRRKKPVEAAPVKELPAAETEAPPAKLGRAVTEYPTSSAKKSLGDAHVVCTEDHPAHGGGHAAVRYKTRGTHATAAHGKEIWAIRWEDPDGVLTVPCDEHRVCKESGLSFTSPQGLSQHKHKHAPEG